MQKYKRPPITEAIIAVGIKSPLSAETLEKIHKKLLEDYPALSQRVVNQFDIEITPTGPQIKGAQQAGYRMSSVDAANLALVFPSQIGTSRLAPYEGWEALAATAKANWENWKRIAGWNGISRIGVRYINRIDIPNPSGGTIDLDEYFTVSPRLPKGAGLPPMNQFTVNAVAAFDDDYRLVLNVASVPSPLLKTASFTLDIDIHNDKSPPQNDEGLWEALKSIRERKNHIFESCITQKTRDLFS